MNVADAALVAAAEAAYAAALGAACVARDAARDADIAVRDAREAREACEACEACDVVVGVYYTPVEVVEAIAAALAGDAGDEAGDWRATIERAAGFYNGGGAGAGANPPAESRAYRRWIVGMWTERHDATSPTYSAWMAAGGEVLVDKADARQEAMADGK